MLLKNKLNRFDDDKTIPMIEYNDDMDKTIPKTKKENMDKTIPKTKKEDMDKITPKTEDKDNLDKINNKVSTINETSTMLVKIND